MKLRVVLFGAASVLFFVISPAIAQSNLLETCPAAVPTPSDAPIILDQALVQIFVYGLSISEVDRERNGDVQQLVFHFPEHPSRGEPHFLQILAGETDERNPNKLKWVEAVPRASGMISTSLRGMACEVASGPFPSVNGFPTSKNQARDVRWKIGAEDLGGNLIFDPSSTSNRLVVSSGVLETCALFLDPDLKKACSAKSKEDPDRFSHRALSEMMVIRQNVARTAFPSTCPDGVDITDSNRTRCIEAVELTGCRVDQTDQCAGWNGRFFKHVVDILIRHSPARPRAPRPKQMNSNHGHHFHKSFPVREYDGWDIEWTQTCKPVQPPCWKYFSETYSSLPVVTVASDDSTNLEAIASPVAITSALDISACPIVDYP